MQQGHVVQLGSRLGECNTFACSQRFASENPNTYSALLHALIDATQYSSQAENRKAVAEAISTKNYLNQPVAVVQQVLSGRYADGLGNVLEDPKRIDFDPFPWQSMAVWILTQMKRWGYVQGDLDYRGIAEQVYRVADAGKVMAEMGMPVPADAYKSFSVMGKPFNPADPEGYLSSFPLRRS